MLEKENETIQYGQLGSECFAFNIAARALSSSRVRIQ